MVDRLPFSIVVQLHDDDIGDDPKKSFFLIAVFSGFKVAIYLLIVVNLLTSKSGISSQNYIIEKFIFTMYVAKMSIHIMSRSKLCHT